MKKTILLIFVMFFALSNIAAETSVNWGERVVLNKEKVNFTLRNSSLKSIPLWIPSVMNPNLSPNSNSGVTLKLGQKVYFKYKGKKEVLLEAKSSYQGRVFDVPKLIADRKLQIDQERKKKKRK